MLAVIPARGGSKGVPHKNIRDLDGKPLIAYTIEAAIKSKVFDKIVVSTDSSEIAEIAQRYGAEVPFIRPKDLSGDFSSSDDVVLHAIDYFKEKEKNLSMYANYNQPLLWEMKHTLWSISVIER